MLRNLAVYAEEPVHPKVAALFKSLKNEINAEIQLQGTIARASGALSMLIRSSIIAQREQNEKNEEPIFGDVLITPILFSMNPEESAETNDVGRVD